MAAAGQRVPPQAGRAADLWSRLDLQPSSLSGGSGLTADLTSLDDRLALAPAIAIGLFETPQFSVPPRACPPQISLQPSAPPQGLLRSLRPPFQRRASKSPQSRTARGNQNH